MVTITFAEGYSQQFCYDELKSFQMIQNMVKGNFRETSDSISLPTIDYSVFKMLLQLIHHFDDCLVDHNIDYLRAIRDIADFLMVPVDFIWLINGKICFKEISRDVVMSHDGFLYSAPKSTYIESFINHNKY